MLRGWVSASFPAPPSPCPSFPPLCLSLAPPAAWEDSPDGLSRPAAGGSLPAEQAGESAAAAEVPPDGPCSERLRARPPAAAWDAHVLAARLVSVAPALPAAVPAEHLRGGVPDPEEPRRGESAVRVRAAFPAVEPAPPPEAAGPARARSDGAPAWLRAAAWGRLAGGGLPATAPADSPAAKPAPVLSREPAELPTAPAARRFSRGLFPGPGELFPDREEPATVRAAATREARPGEKAGPKDPRRDWPRRADRRLPSGDRGAR
jgi:hypothetical protein